MKDIHNQIFDEERALYRLTGARVSDCVFAGPADGESAMKESRNIEVEHCSFSLRYPLWHTLDFQLNNCTMDEKTRAPLWYAEKGSVTDCEIRGVKCLRECREMTFRGDRITSPEFGWKCRDLHFEQVILNSEYAFLECTDSDFRDLDFTGKYSFQYTENITIENAILNTKDAFWHAKNVTVKNSTVNGEYLGWYSEGLTLIDCRISGTQPFCYCKKLRLINCTMENTDLAFEYSEVDADVRGNVLSVKNPTEGRIVADGYGEIILRDSVYPLNCEILIR